MLNGFELVKPGEQEWDSARAARNLGVEQSPTMVARAAGTDEVVAAVLDASCGALIALESIHGQMTERAAEADAMQEHIRRTMRSLREAIDSLRAAQSDGADPLALGFVLKGNRS